MRVFYRDPCVSGLESYSIKTMDTKGMATSPGISYLGMENLSATGSSCILKTDFTQFSRMRLKPRNKSVIFRTTHCQWLLRYVHIDPLLKLWSQTMITKTALRDFLYLLVSPPTFFLLSIFSLALQLVCWRWVPGSDWKPKLCPQVP